MGNISSISNTATTSDAVAFAQAVSAAGAANKRVVIDSVSRGDSGPNGAPSSVSVSWHTENRGSRFVSWIKDLSSGYSRKIRNATDLLLQKGQQAEAGGEQRRSVFNNVRQITAELKNHRGNVAKAFHVRLGDSLQNVPKHEIRAAREWDAFDVGNLGKAVAHRNNQPDDTGFFNNAWG